MEAGGSGGGAGGATLALMPSCMSSWVDTGSVESHRYYLARRTILEMLKDRGYEVPDPDLDLSLHEFRAIYGQTPDVDRLRISLPLLSNPSKKILVIFCGTEKVKLGVMRGILGKIANDSGLNRLILVLQSTITSQAQEALGLFNVTIEIFQINELLVNITKHVLMPKHEILTQEEKRKLLSKYNLKDKQLPRMLLSDAFVRYYGLQKGQIVKVTYDGDLTGTHVTYRCIH